jgi:hypothetical protein
LTGTSGQFLCGCDPETKIARYGDRRFVNGVEVCPEHSEPLYGYLSPQVEKLGLGRAIDYSRKGTGNEFNPSDATYEDRRDNRDPEEAYAQLKLERGIASNGHYKDDHGA